MKNPLLEDEKLLTAIVKKNNTYNRWYIDERSVEKQLNELDEDTTREIICRILNVVFDPYDKHSFNFLKIFLNILRFIFPIFINYWVKNSMENILQ